MSQRARLHRCQPRSSQKPKASQPGCRDRASEHDAVSFRQHFVQTRPRHPLRPKDRDIPEGRTGNQLLRKPVVSRLSHRSRRCGFGSGRKAGVDTPLKSQSRKLVKRGNGRRSARPGRLFPPHLPEGDILCVWWEGDLIGNWAIFRYDAALLAPFSPLRNLSRKFSIVYRPSTPLVAMAQGGSTGVPTGDAGR